MLERDGVEAEIDRLCGAIAERVTRGEPICVLVSGGMDSDVVARLAARVVPPERLRLVTALQSEMSAAHLENARALGRALGTKTTEVDMQGLEEELVGRLAEGSPDLGFKPGGLLDPARMKCSLRTVLASSFEDRGHVVLGTGNRTEAQLGFYLPFGDGVWHFGPIAHLYKSEVRLLAAALGTSPKVLSQPPSAGFWEGQSDREDLGFWLVNGGPIRREREFTAAEEAQAAAWSACVEEASLDRFLLDASHGGAPRRPEGWQPELTARLLELTAVSAVTKNRPRGESLERRW